MYGSSLSRRMDLMPTKILPDKMSLTIRRATADDAPAVARLATLDGSRAPRGDLLVADVAGELWAAVSLGDFHVVADPFRPSGELAFLLLERARQVRHAQRPRRRRGRRLHLRHAA